MRLLTAFLLAALLTVGLSSCGEEDAELLPGETAREITANLDLVRSLADEGDCEGAQAATEQVSTQIEELSVDAELKQALREGAARLDEVVATCVPEVDEEAVEVLPEPSEEQGGKRKKEKSRAKPDEEQDEEPPAAEKEEKPDGGPSLPPQANGKAKGHEKQEQDEETPSGGISPGTSVEEGGD